MASLLEDITELEGELRRLSDGTEELTEREKLRAQFLQAKLARLGAEAQSIRDLRLAEAQRGEMLVCFTTVMLDEFNIDVEVNLSHVCHLLIRNIESASSIPEKEILRTIKSCFRKFRHNLLTISYYITIESLITCVTTLCSGVTINTTSTYVNMAV